MSMIDQLATTAPPLANVVTTVDDLERIVALPTREPVICARDPFTKRFPPATEALIEVMTERLSRPKRLSCACFPRRVLLGADGQQLTIWRLLPAGYPPEPPLVTTRQAFLADNRTPGDELPRKAVEAMTPGSEIKLPSADGSEGQVCITRLNPVQAWTLYEAEQVGGIVGFMGTGSGKTITGILAPLLFPDAKLAVLLIEPKQRVHYRNHYLRLREHFRVPSIIHGESIPGSTVPGTVATHLVSYSMLSQTKNSDMLDVLQPGLLILDECHRACGNSAINRRVKRYCLARIRAREDAIARGESVPPRAIYLLDWSGTLENKSIEDSQMLCAFSLGTGSPLPIDPVAAKRWSDVIDPSYKPDRRSPTARSLQRTFGGGEYDDTNIAKLFTLPEDAIRKGFCQRRKQTRGIVSANAIDVNASIYISERKIKNIPQAVKDALNMVREEWLRPDGEELVEKIEQVACARHIAVGLYPYWAFPKHPCTCAPGAPPRSCDQCKLIEEWYARRKDFNKELRTKLQQGEVNLDSPKLAEEAAMRFYQKPAYQGSLPVWECKSYPAWAEICDRVEYEERIKWIDDFLVQDAARWAKDADNERNGRPGIVWFQSVAFGRRLSEVTGLPYFNGGPGGEERLNAEKGDRSIICSIKALGAGTDGLQKKFCDQLIVEIPASNSSQQGLEQLLARLHRLGQKADTVNTWVYLHVPELMDALRSAYRQAKFNQDMTGNIQKLLLADMDDIYV